MQRSSSLSSSTVYGTTVHHHHPPLLTTAYSPRPTTTHILWHILTVHPPRRQVDGEVLESKARGIGEIIGEMSLFTGGIRGASMVAVTAGSLAVLKFAFLERLKHINEKLVRSPATSPAHCRHDRHTADVRALRNR